MLKVTPSRSWGSCHIRACEMSYWSGLGGRGVLFFTAAENMASNQKACFENGGNTHHHLNQPANYQNPGEPTSTTALMNKRNGCLCAFSGYTMWIPPWCIKKNTAKESERENDMKVANQMRHLSTHEELTRTSSLLMDYSKLLFFIFSHNLIATKRLKTLQLFWGHSLAF